jgi:SAM-dependent methyltransferase
MAGVTGEAVAVDADRVGILRMARMMWALGDYAAVGDLWAAASDELVAEVGVEGLDVLDVATGSGNTALAAARAGGRVTATDLTPELLAVAASRAEAAGFDINWIEGDMAELGLPDASYDRVLSTFGVVFALDPAAMARELVRVCRPGGLIASCAWTPEGPISVGGETLRSFMADPPRLPIDPYEWARPERVTSFFAGLPVEVSCREASVRVHLPSVEAAVTLLETKAGPIMLSRLALEVEGAWPRARAALTDLLTERDVATGGAFALDLPYLIVLARKSATSGS